MALNVFIGMGNLTRDPQLRFTPSQVAIVDFGMAINEKYKDKEKTHFLDVTAFGKTAELINQYFAKGKPILVQGRLDHQTWDDKTSGQKRSKVQIIADSFQFVGGDKTDKGGGAKPSREGGYGAPAHKTSADNELPTSGEPFDEDSIPF